MDTKVQRWLAWSIAPFLIIYFLGFGVIAGFVPPQPPGWSASQLAAWYALHSEHIKIGQFIAISVTGLAFLWPAAISAQMARIERGTFPLLALVQYATGAALALLFLICNLIWCIAAYRPDIDPNTLRMLNDAAWLIFVVAFPEFYVQLGCIAIVGFMDKRPQPFLPGWACYATVAVTVIGCGGGLAGLVTSGPFAWNGIIGFWAPIICFIAWMLGVILPCLLKAISRQEAEAGMTARIENNERNFFAAAQSNKKTL